MEIDLTKTLIQQALWETYKKTGEAIYKELYDKWYANYDFINIVGLNEISAPMVCCKICFDYEKCKKGDYNLLSPDCYLKK